MAEGRARSRSPPPGSSPAHDDGQHDFLERMEEGKKALGEKAQAAEKNHDQMVDFYLTNLSKTAQDETNLRKILAACGDLGTRHENLYIQIQDCVERIETELTDLRRLKEVSDQLRQSLKLRVSNVGVLLSRLNFLREDLESLKDKSK